MNGLFLLIIRCVNLTRTWSILGHSLYHFRHQMPYGFFWYVFVPQGHFSLDVNRHCKLPRPSNLVDLVPSGENRGLDSIFEINSFLFVWPRILLSRFENWALLCHNLTFVAHFVRIISRINIIIFYGSFRILVIQHLFLSKLSSSIAELRTRIIFRL